MQLSAAVQAAIRRLKKQLHRLEQAGERGPTPVIVSQVKHEWLDTIRRQHTWFSIIKPPLDELVMFSRPQRAITLSAVCVFTMALIAFFFGKDPSQTANRVLQ